MSIEYKVGDRVYHGLMGEGTVVQGLTGLGLYMVKYDITPPTNYNMGENPTCSLVEELRRIE